jgi:hypothetical protein
MRWSHTSVFLAACLAFASTIAARAESHEPPLASGCNDCPAARPSCDCAAAHGQKIVVEQPPVEVVFQQAPPTVCCERNGCLKRLFCSPHPQCCYPAAAPTYSYAAPAVQTYAMMAPAAQSFVMAAPQAQSFAFAAPQSQAFAFAAPQVQAFAAPQAQAFTLAAAPAPAVNVDAQALAIYADKLRSALAQAESAQSRIKAESVSDADCCAKVDALIANVKELQKTVMAHGTLLMDHEKRLQTLEAPKK